MASDESRAFGTGGIRGRLSFLLATGLAVVLVVVLVSTNSADTGPNQVEGVIVAVEGDLLTGFERIDILTGDGSMLAVVPAEGLLFDNGAPLGHAQNHLMSGQPVAVEIERRADGVSVAVAIRDVGG